MKVHFATDHAGFELKEELIKFVSNELGYEVVDHGATEFEPEDDYPDYVEKAAKAVSKGGEDVRGIIIGKSGQGEAMAANRFQGVRAAVYYGQPIEIINLSREHNDSNILSLGAGFVSLEEAKVVIQRWFGTGFNGKSKYKRRIHKMDEFESE